MAQKDKKILIDIPKDPEEREKLIKLLAKGFNKYLDVLLEEEE